MFSGIVTALLGMSAAHLKADLKKVEATWAPAKRNLIVTHDQKNTIIVFADIEYKAYIPKKYHAWHVSYTEWGPDCYIVEYTI